MDGSMLWGVAISIYVALGIFALSAADNGPKPTGTIPGSTKMSEWERSEARGQKLLVLWCAGFALLMGAFWVLG